MFTISEILKAVNGTLIQGPAKADVRSVGIDSRSVKKGELFIAIKGDVFDGHDFVADVIARGVRAVVVGRAVSVKAPDVSVILVKDTVSALGDIARFHRLRFNVPVIALTGSAGKTTTKEMMAAVLGRKYKVLKNEGTQNNHIGVPLTLLKLKPAHRIVVLECGTNQPGDMAWLADVARPQTAVFTNIGASHLEKLKSVKGVLQEKWALTSHMGRGDTVIVNADDALLAGQIRRKNDFRVITYGLKEGVDWQAVDIRRSGNLYFKVRGKTIELKPCGFQNVYNALAAVSCGALFKVPLAAVSRVLKAFDGLAGRGQILRLGRGWMINDTYNANPVSMRAALQTLQAVETQGQRIFVAADMLELGSRSRALHLAMGESIAAAGVDVLISAGPMAGLMAAQARRSNKKIQVFACADAQSAQKYLTKVFHNGDAVLIKGSRRMKMEQVSEFLLASPDKKIE
jgi:UDP-N-acetylmuramoyl-tripeptide--D-alanyl-D-alanine ligase